MIEGLGAKPPPHANFAYGCFAIIAKGVILLQSGVLAPALVCLQQTFLRKSSNKKNKKVPVPVNKFSLFFRCPSTAVGPFCRPTVKERMLVVVSGSEVGKNSYGAHMLCVQMAEICTVLTARVYLRLF